MDDAGFLHELLRSPCAETREIAERLYGRRLYKRALYAGVDQVNAAGLQRDTSIAAGREFAREIASLAGVQEHAVLVDIPPLPTEMSMNVQVRNRHAILGLEELSPLVNTLNETRRQQWRLGVYAMPGDRERVEDAAIEVFHVKRATKQHKLPVG
jgi:HD superfamily phosphohydrolase